MSTARNGSPTLYMIACGGRAAADLAPFVAARQRDGWTVCVVATPSALKFMNVAEIAELTGYPVRSDYKQPDEPDVLPLPNAIAVAPATFNTINKWAHGISDTLALGLLNEAIGLGLPVVAVPTPSTALARHPIFLESVGRLQSWGVRILFDSDVYPLPIPNMGSSAATLFPWSAIADEVNTMLAAAIHGLGSIG
ncbi:flavoprotein [Allorhizocola rhizosphaerae]|uniref:flavoprotein n=1 Tax=Allorhizocola rhizosphaerae TaxID=1872709 RepID=UPI000E3C5187|nr:flavoprotein [Allorhizocola rhizosphaerae]